jgi:hypothetical protein
VIIVVKRVEVDCDLCGKECTSRVTEIFIPTSWQVDQGAGGSGTTIEEKFETCASCAARVLGIVIKNADLSYDQGKAIVKRIHDMQEKKKKGVSDG